MLEADADAEYAEIIEIDISQITEPLLACPNDPDDIKPLSAVAGTKIDEVFIGSCMTNIGHFRAAGKVAGKSRQFADPFVGSAADQNGSRSIGGGGLLRYFRQGRRQNGNAGLFAVHGQSGAGG